jgi:hypothetical protein
MLFTSLFIKPEGPMNPMELELQTAKEILAEVFKVRLSEVDEMLQNRIEKAPSQAARCKKDGLWPQEFWLER